MPPSLSFLFFGYALSFASFVSIFVVNLYRYFVVIAQTIGPDSMLRVVSVFSACMSLRYNEPTPSLGQTMYDLTFHMSIQWAGRHDRSRHAVFCGAWAGVPAAALFSHLSFPERLLA
jgi:hypothetical protein